MILRVPASIPLDPTQSVELEAFLQSVINRFYVGAMRYGIPHRRKQYMTRITKEMEVYQKSGNFEQLLNTAVYCFLESLAPENKKFHFDPTAASATREAMGG